MDASGGRASIGGPAVADGASRKSMPEALIAAEANKPATEARKSRQSQIAEADKAATEALKALAEAEEAARPPPSNGIRAAAGDGLPGVEHGPAARVRPLDRFASKPADGAGGRQSYLGHAITAAASFPAPTTSAATAAALAPCPARLARRRVHGPRLEHEGDPSLDSHKPRLSSGLDSRLGRPGDRPGQRLSLALLPRRAEAEVVRDSLFAVAGELDLTMGGPDIDHQLGLSVPRRSLYFRHAAEKQMEFLKIFDVAGVTECYQRRESILPQQALALNNSALHAEALARSRLNPCRARSGPIRRNSLRRRSSASFAGRRPRRSSPNASRSSIPCRTRTRNGARGLFTY